MPSADDQSNRRPFGFSSIKHARNHVGMYMINTDEGNS